MTPIDSCGHAESVMGGLWYRKILSEIREFRFSGPTTIEAQDDTIVWITHAMKGAGANLNVLLRGSAVNYASKAREVLPFGDKTQKNAPHIAEDVLGLIGKGIAVYIIDEDIPERGLADDDLIDGLTRVKRADVPKLLDGSDHLRAW